MSPSWADAPPPPPEPMTAGARWRIAWRGGLLGCVVFGGLGVLLVLRLIERPLCGARRPVTPWITQGVCRAAFPILGMGWRARGKPLAGRGAMVANHGSWLDIFALNAGTRLYFVSKSEVADWPGIGWLARATGTVFIRRNARDAAAQREILRERLAAGHRLLFFPEGTSTDAIRVLPFKSTLFAAFFEQDTKDGLAVQPVTVIYRAPGGADPRTYGWYGEMEFAPHLAQVLARRRQGSVEVVYHPPVKVADFPDRKALAAHCERAVRAALPDFGAAEAGSAAPAER